MSDDTPTYFVARFRNFKVRLKVDSGPMDTPENREKLLSRLGRMVMEKFIGDVKFSSE